MQPLALSYHEYRSPRGVVSRVTLLAFTESSDLSRIGVGLAVSLATSRSPPDVSQIERPGAPFIVRSPCGVALVVQIPLRSFQGSTVDTRFERIALVVQERGPT